MKVNCISCGHNMMLDEAYDDFEGLIKCYVCGALLQVKTSDGKIKSVNLTGNQCQTPATKADVDLGAFR